MIDSFFKLVGSDTQRAEGMSAVTGVQRVIRETHATLVDTLGVRRIGIAPLHTRDTPRTFAFQTNPYMATDPVMCQDPVSLHDVDVILLLDICAHTDFSLIHKEKKERNCPVIALIHDVIPLYSPDLFLEDSQSVFRRYIQKVLNFADYIIVPSEAVKRNILQLGWKIKGELRVIPLGSSFVETPPSEFVDQRLSILYVATIEPRKGHEVALRAFDILRDSGHDVDLTFIGRRGWKYDSIENSIVSHRDYEGRLRWTDKADDLTIRSVARQCNIGIIPSLDEGFGLFLEEGLTLGLKMVASDIPVLLERAQPNVYFTKMSPVEFASSMLRAQRSPWVKAGAVRTMRDFGTDVADLLEEAIQKSS